METSASFEARSAPSPYPTGSSFNVTMKSARPCSAHSQKGASPKSGSASIEPDLTCSASSRSRLMIVPLSAGRTQTPEHGFVLVQYVGTDEPHETVVLDPVANQPGAIVRGGHARLESGDASRDHRRVNDASTPSLWRLRRQPSIPAWRALSDRL